MNAKIQIAAEGPTSLRSRVNPRKSMAGRPTDPVDPTRQSQAIRTAGEVLSDGRFVELVRNGTQECLLRWSNTQTSVASQVACGDLRYTPTPAARLIRHLPTKPVGYGCTEALFEATANFVENNSGMGGEEAAQLAFFAFSSWFSDCLSICPCLFLFGAPLQAVSLLRVLGCICRHPVLSVGSSVGGLPPELRPTRLICQADSRTLQRLPAFQFRGFGMIDPRPRQVSGASVIYAGDAELKTPFAESCLQLWVSSGNRSFGLQDEDQQATTINGLQNQLLLYRLQNYRRVKNSQFEVPEFAGASREYVRTLGQCLVDAPKLQTQLTTLFRCRDDAERTESANQLDAAVMEALIVSCHERKPSVHVSEIARLTNAILGRNGETVELSAKQVGGRMKRLGFRTTRLDAAGRGIYLLTQGCARVHKLGRVLGVAVVREGLPGCGLCNEKE